MQTLTPLAALDQIPGTRTTRKIVAALLPRADARGIATVRRRELAELLGVAEGTVRRLVGMLEKFGLLVRYGRQFVFSFSRRLTDGRPDVVREDAETEAQALAAFADGRRRAGASPRPADPAVAPMILTHARTLASGAMRGVDVMQIARLLGAAYVEDASTPALIANNFPVHPRWVAHALDAMSRGAINRLADERRRAEEHREAVREARAQLDLTAEQREENRRRALDLIGRLGR